MAIDLTYPPPSAVDVSGLSPEAVRAVKSLVAQFRAAGNRPTPAPRLVTAPRPTDDEFDRALKELASGPPVPPLAADWSRAGLCDDHD